MKLLLLLMGLLISPAWASDHLADKNKEDILIFISFAMPDESIKSWLADANTIGASVVIRGLINNNWPKTLAKMNSLLSDDLQGGVQIDPELFQAFDISKVPAVVVVKPVSTSCQTQLSCNDYGKFDVIYGNVSLRYALEKLQAGGEISKATADAALAKLDSTIEGIT